MPNRAYRRGYAAELRAKRILEANGYTCIRAAGSHGPFDVCGFRKDGVVLVQVKRGAARLSPADQAQLRALRRDALPANARVEYWRFIGRKRFVEVL